MTSAGAAFITVAAVNTMPIPEAGCLLWIGSARPNGYGTLRVRGERAPTGAHRAAFEAMSGVPIPAGMNVCHKCDTPACVNAEHLFLGTRSENMADMGRKGRSAYQRHPELIPRGEAAIYADVCKLTSTQVAEIRQSAGKVAALAGSYGVSKGTISRVRIGQRYGYIDPNTTKASRGQTGARKLSAEQVAAIRIGTDSAEELAARFGVHVVTIQRVRQGITYGGINNDGNDCSGESCNPTEQPEG